MRAFQCTQTEQNALDDFDVFCSTMHAAREEGDAADLERLLQYADGLQYVDVSCGRTFCTVEPCDLKNGET